jgi:hypothetical protein
MGTAWSLSMKKLNQRLPNLCKRENILCTARASAFTSALSCNGVHCTHRLRDTAHIIRLVRAECTSKHRAFIPRAQVRLLHLMGEMFRGWRAQDGAHNVRLYLLSYASGQYDW